MNQEKLNYFIKLIDQAISIAEEHREIMQTPEFYQRCKEAGWITQADIDLGKVYLEEKYEYIFKYLYLDRNIIQGLSFVKDKCIDMSIEKDLIKYPKGKRPSSGRTFGISECGHEMWGDCLYDYKIYDACAAVEKYYNHELE